MLLNYIRKVLHIRTPEEDFAAGVKYVNMSVEQYGLDDESQMNRLWAECEAPFDNKMFDLGMASRLKELNVKHPMDQE